MSSSARFDNSVKVRIDPKKIVKSLPYLNTNEAARGIMNYSRKVGKDKLSFIQLRAAAIRLHQRHRVEINLSSLNAKKLTFYSSFTDLQLFGQ